ncbi:MAG: ABC transporter ATP-binding protein [Arenicellales bacterium]
MARIELKNIRHSYPASKGEAQVWALEEVNQVWEDGGAYALLGPSGCGKTTLLNIISGLLTPTEGSVLFDEKDMTQVATIDRHIAQVFQFPVVYDTMTVYQNLAFPLRNRGMKDSDIEPRVKEIAEMLDLTESLNNRAAGLTADGKQKISLGRGLVRPDVNVIMFDEPLTVIDPHLKWQLRSKLKQLHQQVGTTMIYVTHDQTEALTFAETVVVMYEGRVVQVGTPVELFEEPKHTFVGHFIGSPGMNLLPCENVDRMAHCLGNALGIAEKKETHSEQFQVGVRPEFVYFDKVGIPVNLNKVDDLGRYKVAEVETDGHILKMIVDEGQDIPVENPRICFDLDHTRLYRDGWMVETEEVTP